MNNDFREQPRRQQEEAARHSSPFGLFGGVGAAFGGAGRGFRPPPPPEAEVIKDVEARDITDERKLLT